MTMLITILFTFWSSLCKANEFFDEKLYHDVLDPELCARQLEIIDKFIFYDSSFRQPEGLLGGNFVSYGNFHQCLGINQNYPGSDVEGKYCFVKANLSTIPTLRIPTLGGVSESNNLSWTEWKFNWSEDDLFHFQTYVSRDIIVLSMNATEPVIQSVSLSLGVCVPKACTAHALLRRYAEHPLINFTYSEQFCRLPGDKPFVNADHVVFSVLSFIGLLTVISTAYELHQILILKKDQAETSELFRACSLYYNTTRLFTFNNPPQALHCLDGIRVLSVLRIMLYHSYMALFRSSKNKLDFTKGVYELKYFWIESATTSVDTFFILSGLLLVYTTVHKMKQKSLLRNLPLSYMNRFVRLFPLLAGLVLLQVSLLHHVADGPNWHDTSTQVAKCRKYWWSTLLFVQNFFNPLEMCVNPTWYLSVDMQLYVVSPAVMYWALGSARAAWTALIAAVLASLAAALAICLNFNFYSSSRSHVSDDYAEWYYINTITRSPPFFMGMLLGYVLHVFRGKKHYLPKWGVVLGHSLALVLFVYASYYGCALNPTMQPDWDNQPALNVHIAMFRSCWALAVCWMIFACVHSYGGPVNWFLSLKLWRFPARISYAMYLYSMPVLYALSGSADQPGYFSMYNLLSKFFADATYTVALSVVASVVIEAPAVTLYQLLLKAKQSRKEYSL